MAEFLKDLLLAVGGGVGAALIFLGLFKNVIQKWLEATIDQVADKKLAKYSNSLTRKTMAYEILLHKEFEYYEKVGKIQKEVMLTITYFLQELGGGGSNTKPNFVTAEKSLSELGSVILDFTITLMLAHQYLPDNISTNGTEIIKFLTDYEDLLRKGLSSYKQGNLDKSFAVEIKCFEEMYAIKFGQYNKQIQDRLKALSEVV